MLFNLKDKIPELRDNWEKYAGMWKRIEVPAGTLLLKEGEISGRAFNIEKGCLRTWFVHNDKEITFQFFFENESIASIESFIKQIPGIFNIESIEPSILHWISKKDFETVLREVPAVKEYLFKIMLERQINYANHFINYIKYNPRQRYIHLLKTKPEIIKRVPQHYIASYLGITPVSLSRIRNRISKKDLLEPGI